MLPNIFRTSWLVYDRTKAKLSLHLFSLNPKNWWYHRTSSTQDIFISDFVIHKIHLCVILITHISYHDKTRIEWITSLINRNNSCVSSDELNELWKLSIIRTIQRRTYTNIVSLEKLSIPFVISEITRLFASIDIHTQR